MSGHGPVVTAGPSPAASDSRSLVLHLEVCRLQSELERLESRLAGLRSNHVDGSDRASSAGDPRADDVIDRMVATLMESGRSDIATSAATRLHTAEERLGVERARAAAIVASARADLDRALAERGQSLHEGWEAGFDIVVLADRDDPPPVVAAPLGLTAPVEVVEIAEPVRPRAAEVEEARTDAAFEAWMAVAPGAGVVDDGVLPDQPPTSVGPSAAVSPVPTEPEAESESDAETQTSGPDVRARSRWLLPLEVVGALLAAAILVVLVLVLVG